MLSSPRRLYETHTHTPLCQHACGSPEEYAEMAWRRGLEGMLVTCHNPMPDGFSRRVRMAPEEFPFYVDCVQRARVALAGRVDVRLGLECDYFPGFEDWLERQLASADFHYVIGSVHPHTAEYVGRFWRGDPWAFQRDYFDQLAAAAETKLFDCLAHPDVVKNEVPEAWAPQRLMEDVCRALDRIAAAGVALELNTSGVYKSVAEMNPFPEMLLEMRARGIPVVVGSDAHEPGRVGDRFGEALDLLAECGYEYASYFLDRTRHDVLIREARQSLRDSVPPVPNPCAVS